MAAMQTWTLSLVPVLESLWGLFSTRPNVCVSRQQ